MRLRHQFVVTNEPGLDASSDYFLRRDASGAWEYQMTQESWMVEVRRLQEIVSRKALLYEEHLARLKAIEGGPRWEPLPDRLAPSLEAAYQRFIHQRAW
jgi:hypothetical protein